jgi:hypothetical protein
MVIYIPYPFSLSLPPRAIRPTAWKSGDGDAARGSSRLDARRWTTTSAPYASPADPIFSAREWAVGGIKGHRGGGGRPLCRTAAPYRRETEKKGRGWACRCWCRATVWWSVGFRYISLYYIGI